MYQQSVSWVPEWARQAIFYHIYPFGFLKTPSTNDLSGAVEPRLADLRSWYDHIANLGINAIWLGPVFESLSHGYDTVDYLTVDRRLGDTPLLHQIVDELHERGIRVILDGVFHHTSREFFAFRELRQHRQDSRYKDWYLVYWESDSDYGDGFAYECWEGHQSLPKLNLANPDTRRHIFDVARYWLSEIGIDGWRLDVAYCIPAEFWWEFRRVCKEVKPDCLLLAEMIHGDYRAWVAPDLLDVGTNYQVYTAIWRSLNERNYWELRAVSERAWHPDWGLYKDLVLFNFIGNHDVPRILAEIREPRHIYPALIFLMTVPGIPCLYYGDELGLHSDPRESMPPPDAPWPDRDRAIYNAIVQLAQIRKDHPSLMYGSFRVLNVNDLTFAYLRQHSAEHAVVVLNAGDKPAGLELSVGAEGIQDGIRFRDVLNDDHAEFSVQGGVLRVEPIHPAWGRILITH